MYVTKSTSRQQITIYKTNLLTHYHKDLNNCW